MKNKPLYLYVLNLIPAFRLLHEQAKRVSPYLSWSELRFCYLSAVTRTLMYFRKRILFQISKKEFIKQCLEERNTLWLHVDNI